MHFASGAFEDRNIVLEGVWGRERLSRLYQFDLLLRRYSGVAFTDKELDDLLKAPCTFAFGSRSSGEVVHGVIESIDILDSPHDHPRYTARVVPNVFLLTLTKTSRLYQDTTIPDLIRTVLGAYGMKEDKHFV